VLDAQLAAAELARQAQEARDAARLAALEISIAQQTLVSSFVIQWSDLDAVVRVDQIRSQRPAGFSTLADFQRTDSTFADSRRL
jgi:hypothetical protein